MFSLHSPIEHSWCRWFAGRQAFGQGSIGARGPAEQCRAVVAKNREWDVLVQFDESDY